MKTMTYTGTLVVRACWCGITHAIPDQLNEQVRRGKEAFCPLGHRYYQADKTVDQEIADAQARAERASQRAAATRALLEHEQRSHASTRGHLTRRKRQVDRVRAGVCPCCNRTFQNLARHMTGQHPDFPTTP